MPENNVGLILNPGCLMWKSSRKAVSYANKYHLLYAVGIHPENIEDGWEADLETIRALAQRRKQVRAIGEVVLTITGKKTSVRVRSGRLYLPAKWSWRVHCTSCHLHDRDAHADSMESVGYPDVIGVYHCCLVTSKWHANYWKLGCICRLPVLSHLKNAKKAKKSFVKCRLKRLMIKDRFAHRWHPSPFRGRRNSSLYVHHGWNYRGNQRA